MTIKSNPNFHPKNTLSKRYDFLLLTAKHHELKKFIVQTEYGNFSIDFFNPNAVKALNTALLKLHFGLIYWDIPKNYLCPPIPSRADYIHHIHDLIKPQNTSNPIKCLDIGTGANCIYPIIGNRAYGWQFIASEIDPIALASAQNIIDKNESLALNAAIELRLQKNPINIYKGIIQKNEYFEIAMCNPPFHESAEKAALGSLRKVKNLKKNSIKKVTLNFGGMPNELWCKGGELQFISTMIRESVLFKSQVKWFTSLVSKQETIYSIKKLIKLVGAKSIKTIDMTQGNKTSRIIAWSFH